MGWTLYRHPGIDWQLHSSAVQTAGVEVVAAVAVVAGETSALDRLAGWHSVLAVPMLVAWVAWVSGAAEDAAAAAVGAAAALVGRLWLLHLHVQSWPKGQAWQPGNSKDGALGPRPRMECAIHDMSNNALFVEICTLYRTAVVWRYYTI